MKLSKQLITASLIVLSAIPLSAQITEDKCHCNDIFDQNIRNDFASYNRAEARKFFYDFLMSDKKTRKNMKRSSSSSFGLGVVVDGLPIDFNSSNTNSGQSGFLNEERKKAQSAGLVSDLQVNSIITTFISNRAWDSYDNCLKTCGRIMSNQSGVKILATYESDDMVQIKVGVKTIQGDKITIKKVNYIGGQAIGGQTFYSGKVIREGQTAFEDIKRVKGKDLIISIAFEESWMDGLTYTFENKPLVTEKPISSPIGIIISSVLPYMSFLEANNQKYTGDMTKAKWVPCDGRSISSTQGYGKFTGGVVPDLRGLFLRGINDMGDIGPSISPVSEERANPENKVANEFQSDLFKSHHHNSQVSSDRNGDPDGSDDTSNGAGAGDSYWRGNKNLTSPTKETTNSGGVETRPKNVTVYYYIKIN